VARNEWLEGRGQHPDNRVFTIVHQNGSPEHMRISSEAPLPEAIAQEKHPPPFGGVVRLDEIAAQGRPDAKQLKEIPADLQRLQTLWLAISYDCRIPRADH
jgi:hypothetical protein